MAGTEGGGGAGGGRCKGSPADRRSVGGGDGGGAGGGGGGVGQSGSLSARRAGGASVSSFRIERSTVTTSSGGDRGWNSSGGRDSGADKGPARYGLAGPAGARGNVLYRFSEAGSSMGKASGEDDGVGGGSAWKDVADASPGRGGGVAERDGQQHQQQTGGRRRDARASGGAQVRRLGVGERDGGCCGWVRLVSGLV